MTRPRPSKGRRRSLRPLPAAALVALLAAPPLLASPQSNRSSSSSQSSSDRATAQDSAQDSQRSSQKSSHTRRVVVKDGRTVVDEETRDGRPVRAGGRKASAPRRTAATRGVVAPGNRAGAAKGALDPEAEVERMMREMEERMRREMPPAMADLMREARAKGGPVQRSARSSYTRRFKVVDGKVVVDEETRDGKPVRGGHALAPRGQAAPGATDPHAEVERMMREMEAEMRRQMGGAQLPRANGGGQKTVDRQSAKSTHTRRVVVENGRTVVDEETRDGVPVRGGPGRPGGRRPGVAPRAGGGDPQLEIQQIMRDFEAEQDAARRRRSRGKPAVRPGRTGPQPLRPVRGSAPPLRPRPGRSAPAAKGVAPEKARPGGAPARKSGARKVTGGR